MPFALLAPGLSAEQLVAALADPHRSVEARRRLIALGQEAAQAACEGLKSPDAHAPGGPIFQRTVPRQRLRPRGRSAKT